MNILLLENNPSDRDKIIRNILASGEKHNTYVCTNIEQADIALRNQDPDIILSDLAFSDSTAKKTISYLKGLAYLLPVVILTNNENESLAQEAIRGGIQDYVNKGDLDSSPLNRILDYSVSRKKLELSLRENEISLDKANNILRITSEVSKLILDRGADVHATLKTISDDLELDLIFVYCCENEGSISQYWAFSDKLDKGNSTLSHGIENFNGKAERFISRNLPISSKTKNLPEPISTISKKVCAPPEGNTVVIPVMMDQAPWGIFGYCTSIHRKWSSSEIQAISNLTMVAASTMKRRQAEQSIIRDLEDKFSAINKRINGDV